MAEELLRVLRCDMDGSTDDVQTFHIRFDGIEAKVDLCAKHAKPVRAAAEAGARTSSLAGDLAPAARAALDRRLVD